MSQTTYGYEHTGLHMHKFCECADESKHIVTHYVLKFVDLD